MTNFELAIAYVLVSLIGAIAGRAVTWFFMLPAFGKWTYHPNALEVLNSFTLVGFPIAGFAGFAANQLAFGNVTICFAIFAGHLLTPFGFGAFKIFVNVVAYAFEKIDAGLRRIFGNID